MLLNKTEGPVKSMEYFGLTRHTESMSVKIPEETIKQLLKKLNEDAFFLKITLKQLQSLCDSLPCCTRTLPAGRAFSGRLYLATAKAKKTLQLNKVTKEMYEDLLMLKYFL